jgi:hypothetical protein
MEFFKGTKKMVAVAYYHRPPFLWHHYCFCQQLGHRSLYLYHLLGECTSLRVLRLYNLQLKK